MPYGTLAVDTVQSSTANTPPQFNDGNGTQVGTLCRAWVNFDGTTAPPTIKASFNVTSVTKNSTGNYTANFTNAMVDANYCLSANGSYDISGATPTNYTQLILKQGSGYNTTSSCRISTVYATGTAGGPQDFQYVNMSIFR